MAESNDWRISLSATLRIGNIEKLRKVLEESGSTGEGAFEKEGQIYKNATSRAEYDAAITAVTSSCSVSQGDTDQEKSPSCELSRDTGETIGSYRGCYRVGEGLTSLVFRSADRALKVVVETRNVEPHDPIRESKILSELKRPCIPLLETFRDQEQRFVLVFPYMPLTLGHVLDRGEPLSRDLVRSIFRDIFQALQQIHCQGIIHRDIKPSAILLHSMDERNPGALLADFGTAWHPRLSIIAEPSSAKILDIGTGPYRAPDVLFGNTSYGTAVDMWGIGALLAECSRKSTPRPLFDSPPTHEDGSQLGLILSIFKTIGSPTLEVWPEAARFKTPPFEMYRSFERRSWDDILPDVDLDIRNLVASLVQYGNSRRTAEEALNHPCMANA